jgi:Fe-S cluster assembly iron-binding protein IscA
LGIALDEKRQNDELLVIEGISVIFDGRFRDFVAESKIDYQQSYFYGKGLIVRRDNCSC